MFIRNASILLNNTQRKSISNALNISDNYAFSVVFSQVLSAQHPFPLFFVHDSIKTSMLIAIRGHSHYMFYFEEES